MGRLIAVSNRVATPTETKGSAGGLAVGIFSALKDMGGIWFGWNGDVVSEAVANAGPTMKDEGSVTFATVGLTRRDYDQYYRGFSNATLWPVFHYRNDLAAYEREEYAGYRRVNAWLAHKLVKQIEPDDIVWVHDYHLIPFGEALRHEGVGNRVGFFLHTPFPAPQVLLNVPPHQELIKSLCCYDLVGFQTDTDRCAFHDYIVRYAGGTVTEARRSSRPRDLFPRKAHVPGVSWRSQPARTATRRPGPSSTAAPTSRPRTRDAAVKSSLERPVKG